MLLHHLHERKEFGDDSSLNLKLFFFRSCKELKLFFAWQTGVKERLEDTHNERTFPSFECEINLILSLDVGVSIRCVCLSFFRSCFLFKALFNWYSIWLEKQRLPKSKWKKKLDSVSPSFSVNHECKLERERNKRSKWVCDFDFCLWKLGKQVHDDARSSFHKT